MRASRWTSWGLPLAALMAAGLPVMPVAAQSTTTTAPTTGSPVCMVKTLRSGPHVAAQSVGKPFAVIVTSEQVAALSAAGYTKLDCSGAGLTDPAKIATYRDQVCSLVHYGDIKVYQQFADATGVMPTVLCSGAEGVAGAYVAPTGSQ